MNKTIEKVLYKVDRITNKVLLAGLAYVILLAGAQGISNFTSPRITSQSQLEQVVEKEKRELDPNSNYEIVSKLVSKETGTVELKDKGKYKLRVGGLCATESTVRHELYHIFDGHLPNVENISEVERLKGTSLKAGLKYWLWSEPQATIYQVTGLKP